MSNLDPWKNQFENEQGITTIATTTLEEEKNKYENYLLFVRTECKKTIESNSHQHPTFFEHYQKIIEMIDCGHLIEKMRRKEIQIFVICVVLQSDNN